MGTFTLQFDSWSLAWRGLRQRLAPRCSLPDCMHTGSVWRRLRGTPPSIMIRGARYCADRCLERGLTDALRRARPAPQRSTSAHRVPLGLLLLARQQLTAEQLRAALAAQRVAGHGRIGEWLQQMGFVTEQQVTAALARQWSCPILRSDFSPVTPEDTPEIPVSLLQSLLMVPVAYVKATATLHIACGEGIDYGVLYALEQMLGCHTEPCLAAPSFVRQRLEMLSAQRARSEILFERATDVGELARVVQSYSVRVAAREIRVAVCGGHVWIRLLRGAATPVDLLFRTQGEPASATSSFDAAPAV